MPHRNRQVVLFRKKKKTALVIAKSNRRILKSGIENKETFDNDINVNITNGATTFDLTNVAQGVNAAQRLGNKVTWKNLEIDLAIQLVDAGQKALVRVLLIKDKQPQGNPVNPVDIFDDNTIVNVLTSRFNRNNVGGINRFIIMMDKLIQLDRTAGPRARIMKIRRKLNLQTRYSAAGGTIGEVLTNGLTLMLIGTEAANLPTVNIGSRRNFIDL